MNCLLIIGRIFCVVINILFLIIGLTLFVLGMILKFGDHLFESFYEEIITQLEQSLRDAEYTNVSIDFSFSDLVGGLALALIIIGTFLLILTIFGLGGACCKVKCMLIGYVVMLSVVLIGQIIFIIIFYARQELISGKIKDNLKSSIQSDFLGLNGTNIASLGWNFVNQMVGCCGVDSYQDFTGATNWVTNYPGHTLQTPLSCCKTLPSSKDYTCASSPTTSNNYLNTSCFDFIWDMVLGNAKITATVLAFGSALQLLLIIVEFFVFLDVRKNKVGTGKA